MSQEDNENLTYENESRLSRCSHCERLAEDNSNLEKLIKHLKEQVRSEKERRQFAEGELSIVKGIGQNSPEVKALKKEIKQLKQDAKELLNYP